MSTDLPQEREQQSVPGLSRTQTGDAVSLASGNRGRALAIVCTLGAIGGAAIGTTLLAALQMRAPGGFHWTVDIPFGLVFGGSFGAVVGALGAPLMGWFFFRHVPLGRAMAITGAGTVVGAVVGLLTAGAPVLGGLTGFALSAAALRFHPRAC